ncbi:MAG: NAD(+) synthase [Candidatus Margulisbacteria bacterium]|nr:NAD(+) synthase [Candidatus Margulisiibacteriota bacterium]
MTVNVPYNIALIQFNPVVGNPCANSSRIVDYINRVSKKGATVVFFGEMALTGYHAQDIFFNEQIVEQTNKAWKDIKKSALENNCGVCVGMPRRNPHSPQGAKHLYNSIRFYQPPSYEFVQDKVCIPTYGEFDEYRWFQPASIRNIKIRKINDDHFGFLICEDGWNNKYGIENRLYRLYLQDPIEKLINSAKNKGIKLKAIVNLSASPDYIGKQDLRIEMFSKIAEHYKVPLVFLNIVGAQDELIFGGRSFIINENGQLIHEMKGFTEDEFIFCPAQINSYKKQNKTKQKHNKYEELDSMMGLYLKDYFRKSSTVTGKVKTILGLSGGKDSTAVAAILKRHLGKDAVEGVIMPYKISQYTMPESVTLAQELADKLGIKHRTIDISMMVDSTSKELQLQPNSLAHQNLQARTRSMILWSIANKEGMVVINTTNFSEAATGYGTIGGDLLGLPILASLPATTVIQYLKWLKEKGEQAISEEMIGREPSAELAPNQKDADELGDYEYIDPILESIRMNFGDMEKVVEQFMDVKNTIYGSIYNGTPQKKKQFIKTLKFLAKKLLTQTEYKRWYYNKTPQFTPFSWLRWKWPVVNGYMDIEKNVDNAFEKLGLG